MGPPVEKDKRVLAMRSLMTISGIGCVCVLYLPYSGHIDHAFCRKVAAAKLVDAGCRGLEDLNQPYLFEMLGPAQKIGFRYLTQIGKPVQREEAEALAVCAIICNCAATLKTVISGVYPVVCWLKMGSDTSRELVSPKQPVLCSWISCTQPVIAVAARALPQT